MEKYIIKNWITKEIKIVNINELKKLTIDCLKKELIEKHNDVEFVKETLNGIEKIGESNFYDVRKMKSIIKRHKWNLEVMYKIKEYLEDMKEYFDDLKCYEKSSRIDSVLSFM